MWMLDSQGCPLLPLGLYTPPGWDHRGGPWWLRSHGHHRWKSPKCEPLWNYSWKLPDGMFEIDVERCSSPGHCWQTCHDGRSPCCRREQGVCFNKRFLGKKELFQHWTVQLHLQQFSLFFFESASHSDTLQHVFLRPRCSRDGAHGLVHPEPESLRRDHSSISPQGCPAAYSILPVNPGSPAWKPNTNFGSVSLGSKVLHLQAVQTFFLHVTEELVFSATLGPVAVLIQGYSSKHEAWYRDNASKALFKLMCQDKSRHYQPEVVKAIKDTKKQDDDQVNPEPKRKTRGGGGSRTSEKPKRKSRGGKAKGKGRGKGKGKGSKKRKASVDEGDEEEDFLEEDEELETASYSNLFYLECFFLLVTFHSSLTCRRCWIVESCQEDEASEAGDDDDEEEDSV